MRRRRYGGPVSESEDGREETTGKNSRAVVVVR